MSLFFLLFFFLVWLVSESGSLVNEFVFSSSSFLVWLVSEFVSLPSSPPPPPPPPPPPVPLPPLPPPLYFPPSMLCESG